MAFWKVSFLQGLCKRKWKIKKKSPLTCVNVPREKRRSWMWDVSSHGWDSSLGQETCAWSGPVITQLSGQVDRTCCELRPHRYTLILLASPRRFFFCFVFFFLYRTAAARQTKPNQPDTTGNCTISQPKLMLRRPSAGGRDPRLARKRFILKSSSQRVCFFFFPFFVRARLTKAWKLVSRGRLGSGEDNTLPLRRTSLQGGLTDLKLARMSVLPISN